MASELEQAIAYALSREVVIGDEYYSVLTATQRAQAVSIAGLAEIEQVKYVMAQVNSAIINGSTFEQFQANVNLENIDLPRHRLRTIYQTNLQSAYSHGRWVQQQANAKNKPYLIYLTKNDSLVRPEHQFLHKTIRPIGDAFWLYNTPPLSWNCRCVSRALTSKEAEQYGITLAVDLPESVAANGFGHSPELYNDKFKSLVQDKVSELMLDNFKQSSQIAQINSRINTAVDKVLSKPKTALNKLLDAAKKLLGR